MNEKTYTPDNRCKRCGTRERYKSNRGCVVCVKRSAVKHQQKTKPTPTDPMEGLL